MNLFNITKEELENYKKLDENKFKKNLYFLLKEKGINVKREELNKVSIDDIDTYLKKVLSKNFEKGENLNFEKYQSNVKKLKEKINQVENAYEIFNKYLKGLDVEEFSKVLQEMKNDEEITLKEEGIIEDYYYIYNEYKEAGLKEEEINKNLNKIYNEEINELKIQLKENNNSLNEIKEKIKKINNKVKKMTNELIYNSLPKNNKIKKIFEYTHDIRKTNKFSKTLNELKKETNLNEEEQLIFFPDFTNFIVLKINKNNLENVKKIFSVIENECKKIYIEKANFLYDEKQYEINKRSINKILEELKEKGIDAELLIISSSFQGTDPIFHKYKNETELKQTIQPS